MLRRLLAILPVIACLALTTGCFVIEEIDSGMALMEKHGGQHGNRTAEAEEEAPKAAGKVDLEYWENARTITSGEGSKDVTSCNLRGQLQFMKRDDCIRRGGQPG